LALLFCPMNQLSSPPAFSALRATRAAIPIPETLAMMAENLGTAIDERCFAALKLALERLPG